MKLVALMFICVGLCNAFEDQCQGDYLKAVYLKCLAAHGGDRVVIDDLHESRESSNENGKCFRACLLQECKYFSIEGKFNDDVPTRIASILHGGNETHVNPIEEAAAKCLDQQTYDESDCNIAEKFTRCLVHHSTVPLKLHGVAI